MSLSAIIFILAVFGLGMLLPIPWWVALPLMFILYYYSPICIAWIEHVLWKLRIGRR